MQPLLGVSSCFYTSHAADCPLCSAALQLASTRVFLEGHGLVEHEPAGSKIAAGTRVRGSSVGGRRNPPSHAQPSPVLIRDEEAQALELEPVPEAQGPGGSHVRVDAAACQWGGREGVGGRGGAY